MSKKQKKEPVKAPVKIDKESATKSLRATNGGIVGLPNYRFEVRKHMGDVYDSESYPIAMDIIKVLEKHHVTYTQAKEALSLTDQVLLNKLLDQTKMHYSSSKKN